MEMDNGCDIRKNGNNTMAEIEEFISGTCPGSEYMLVIQPGKEGGTGMTISNCGKFWDNDAMVALAIAHFYMDAPKKEFLRHLDTIFDYARFLYADNAQEKGT